MATELRPNYDRLAHVPQSAKTVACGCTPEAHSRYCINNLSRGANLKATLVRTADLALRERHASCMNRIACEQSREAFAELFEFFAPRLKNYMQRLGANESEAEELVQDVMITVWRKAEMYDARQASVSTWIFRVARNRRICPKNSWYCCRRPFMMASHIPRLRNSMVFHWGQSKAVYALPLPKCVEVSMRRTSLSLTVCGAA